jgi:methyl-accepting chemotaxis protein
MNISHLIRSFTIRTRMVGAIAVVLALLAMVGGCGLWGLSQVAAANQHFVANVHQDLEDLSLLRVAMGDLRRYEKDLILNTSDAAAVASYQTKWKEAADRAHKHAQDLATGLAGEINPAVNKLMPLLNGYIDKARPVLTQAVQAGTGDAVALNKQLAPAKADAHTAEQELAAIGNSLDKDKAEHIAKAEQIIQRSYIVFSMVVAVAVLVVVPLTLLNMSSICNPIAQAKALAERITTGDLTSKVDAEGNDEATHLLQSLAAMQASLGDIVGQVRQTAESIKVASAEVASGNTDLSHRTEQAAASLQQTASSMEQLTGNVRQTGDAASQANQLASSASSVAQRGGQVVSQVVTTMDEINHSSKRIADIIGTIDGIAFQTNILALNAAVEAARAGEQGRGFAVVAGEVRSLAQRSADAAREIKGLITASVERVDTGARLVQDAGATMGEIVASVQRVTDIIGEITAAANEQTSGIVQVNGAVTSLDQMTQQNAALVEESAAAAESLRDQASRLTDVVARFHLNVVH